MTMLDRVARAMFEATQDKLDTPWDSPWVTEPADGEPNSLRDVYLKAARAAIEAMQTPTEEQWQAAWSASEDYFCSDAITVKGFRLGLQALLDAALNHNGRSE